MFWLYMLGGLVLIGLLTWVGVAFSRSAKPPRNYDNN